MHVTLAQFKNAFDAIYRQSEDPENTIVVLHDDEVEEPCEFVSLISLLASCAGESGAE